MSDEEDNQLNSSLTSMDWLPMLKAREVVEVESLEGSIDTSKMDNSEAMDVDQPCNVNCNEADPEFDPNSKPPYSYATLIKLAISNSSTQMATLADIYDWIMDSYPYYKTAGIGWKNSIRHNLSLNKTFCKVPRPKDDPGKGCYWTINKEEFSEKPPSVPAPFTKTNKLRELVIAHDLSTKGSLTAAQPFVQPNPFVRHQPEESFPISQLLHNGQYLQVVSAPPSAATSPRPLPPSPDDPSPLDYSTSNVKLEVTTSPQQFGPLFPNPITAAASFLSPATINSLSSYMNSIQPCQASFGDKMSINDQLSSALMASGIFPFDAGLDSTLLGDPLTQKLKANSLQDDTLPQLKPQPPHFDNNTEGSPSVSDVVFASSNSSDSDITTPKPPMLSGPYIPLVNKNAATFAEPTFSLENHSISSTLTAGSNEGHFRTVSPAEVFSTAPDRETIESILSSCGERRRSSTKSLKAFPDQLLHESSDVEEYLSELNWDKLL